MASPLYPTNPPDSPAPVRVTPDARAPDHVCSAPSARPGDSVRVRPTRELAGANAQTQNQEGAAKSGRGGTGGGAGGGVASEDACATRPVQAFATLIALTRFNLDPYSSISVLLLRTQGTGVV